MLSLIHYAEVQAVLTFVGSFLVLILSAFSIVVPSFVWTWISSSYVCMLVYVIGVASLLRWLARGGQYLDIQTANLEGKTFIVTGAAGGIGRETASELAKRGARVILLARPRNISEAIAHVKREARSPNNVVGYAIDLSDLQSVKSCAEELMANESEKSPITALINNAGVMACPFTKTKDGLEMQMGTNHFGHFYLTKLLLPRLQSSRIVNVSSLGHSIWRVPCDAAHYTQMCQPESYNAWSAYSLSKNANIIFTQELQRRFASSHGIRAYALHPGVVMTELERHMGVSDFVQTIVKPIRYLFCKTPVEGAQTSLYCALSSTARPGGYHVDCRVQPVLQKYASDDQVARDWWDFSEKTIQEKRPKMQSE